MIKLVFVVSRETFLINVDKKEIWYTDKNWFKGIRCIPKDPEFVKRIVMSRNKFPKTLIKMFNLSEREQAEYDNAGSEEELAKIVIKDCERVGGKLMVVEMILSRALKAGPMN